MWGDAAAAARIMLPAGSCLLWLAVPVAGCQGHPAPFPSPPLPLASDALEVGLCVVPHLDEAVPQREGCSLVALKVVELVPGARQRVLNMVDNAFLDGEHVILAVRVCVRVCFVQQWRWRRQFDEVSVSTDNCPAA